MENKSGGKVGLPATLGTLDGMKKNGAAFTMVDDGYVTWRV